MSIQINILFFGAAADAAGRREMVLETSAETTDALFREVVEAFPKLSAHKLLFALNADYADGSETLRNGDDLAIFTAVSGG